MTLDKTSILAMKAGRELDALIAEKVLRLNVVCHDWPCGRDPECGHYDATNYPDAEGLWFDDKGPVYIDEHSVWPPEEDADRWFGRFAHVHYVPFYSTDLSAAWEVLEKFEMNIYHNKECGEYIASIGTLFEDDACPECGVENFHVDYAVTVETAPEAICKVALLAVLNLG